MLYKFNAVEIVKSLNAEKVLFVPDTYLGKWVESKLKNVEVITFNGFCPTHLRIRVSDIELARKNYPDALILTHPECHSEVSKLSDFVGSTKEIMDFAQKSDNKQFIIATEKGVVQRLNRDSQKYNWNKEFILINPNIVCPNMKQNSLEDIYNVLLNENNEINIDTVTAKKAVKSLDRMLNARMSV